MEAKYIRYTLLLCLTIFTGLSACPVLAQDKSTPTNSAEVSRSPKNGWGEFEVVEEEQPIESPWRTAAMWLPNRLLDIWDIFHVDLGLGPANGGVLRVSKYAQVGYREMNPASARLGLMGRRVPFMIERTNEIGIGPNFVPSKDRDVCPGEVGVGLDILAVGGYAGICLDEVVDFLGGIFLFDPKDDDL